MNSLESLEKLDHTLCLNSPILKYGIDDEDHIDCKDVDEMIECIDNVRQDLEILQLLVDNFKFFATKQFSSKGILLQEFYSISILSSSSLYSNIYLSSQISEEQFNLFCKWFKKIYPTGELFPEENKVGDKLNG